MEKSVIGAKRIIIIAALIIAIFIIFIFGVQIALFINFILGNDVIVRLDADKESLFLVHNQEESVSFDANIVTNPFCKAKCSLRFEDLSYDRIIDEGAFELKPTQPLHKTYTLKAPDHGTGQDLYRFSMECRAASSFLCHTGEESNTRNILVTLNYNLTEDETVFRDETRDELTSFASRVSGGIAGQLMLATILSELNKTMAIDELYNELDKTSFKDYETEITNLKSLWENQEYKALTESMDNFEAGLNKAETIFKELNASIIGMALDYNGLIDDLEKTRETILTLGKAAINNETANNADRLANEFNRFDLNKREALDTKNASIAPLLDNATAILADLGFLKEQLAMLIKLDTGYDTLCLAAGICYGHATIIERSYQNEFNDTCSEINRMIARFNEVKAKINDEFEKQSYPEENEFWRTIANIRIKLSNDVKRSYIDKINENSTNYLLLQEILYINDAGDINELGNYNLTPALAMEVVNAPPEKCGTITLPKEISPAIIAINETPIYDVDITLKEKPPQCCTFNRCGACCVNGDCNNDPALFPVVFIHGHAVNSDVSAEYSLEGFNDIQDKLEEDGYINAGTITLYTARDIEKGLWGWTNAPLSIRASYYFDVFKTPENYIIVQTKSENIDTYAVRLKELLDTILSKTNKPKINLVAFSMGGLVARRYVQIFGAENVNKLILIGVPNHGIFGHVADFCPILGEKLECKDMSADSLFINKLNREALPKIPVHNIIGTGCISDDKLGDGIVLEESAYLKGATNYLINGTCKSKIKPLHLELRDINLYPEVYDIVLNALNKG